MLEHLTQTFFGDASLAALPSMSSEELARMTIIGGTLVLAAFATAMWAVVSTTRTRERERTKREIAAYVAEGSISPEQAEKLIAADMPAWAKSEAWGCSPRKPKVARIRFDKANGTVEVTRG